MEQNISMEGNRSEGNRSMKELIERSDLQGIKDDIGALKDDAIVLANDIRNNGGKVAREGVDQIRNAGRDNFVKVEEHVREKPGQSLALAFCAGLAVSYLMGAHR